MPFDVREIDDDDDYDDDWNQTNMTSSSKSGMPVWYEHSNLTDDDLHLFNEGRHFNIYEKLGSRPLNREGQDGASFAVWAPNAESVAVMGDFNGWNKESHPLAPRGHSGIWEGFIPGAGVGDALQVFHPVADERVLRGEGGSIWVLVGDAAEDGVDRVGSGLRVARRGLDARPAPAQRAELADVDLRGASGVVAEAARGGGTIAELPRDGRRAGGLRERDGLHARGVDARDGASVLCVVGLPGDGVFRAVEPVWDAAGVDDADRPAASAGDRGDPGLGAVALCDRRVRAGVFRRVTPV